MQAQQQDNCKDCGQEFTSKMVFGRFVERCNDCKTPFPTATYNWKKEQDARRSRWIREHNCVTAGCASVCTAFDY